MKIWVICWGIAVAPQCFIFTGLLWRNLPLTKNLQLLWFEYCTWPYCDLNNILINWPSLMWIPLLDHSTPKKGGNDYGAQFVEGGGRRERGQFQWSMEGKPRWRVLCRCTVGCLWAGLCGHHKKRKYYSKRRGGSTTVSQHNCEGKNWPKRTFEYSF